MSNDNAINSLKAYLFPTVVSILSAMIWYDVSEIKKDVKVLMAQSNIDKTRIDHIEKEIDRLLVTPPSSSVPLTPPKKKDHMLVYSEFILDMPRKRVVVVENLKKKPHIHA